MMIKQNVIDRMRNSPPYYPNGWIPILESSELKRTADKLVYFDCEHIIIARDGSGIVSAKEANCMWCGTNAHRISSDGRHRCQCAVKRGHLRNRTSMESYGYIYLWHSKSGEEKPRPFDQSIHLDDQSDFVRVSRVKFELRNSHIQDFVSNGADMAHFNEVHKTITANEMFSMLKIVFLVNSLFEWLNNKLFYDYTNVIFNEINSQVSYMEYYLNWYVMDKAMPIYNRVNVLGPLTYHIRQQLYNGMTNNIFHTFMPMGELKQRVVWHIYLPKSNWRILNFITGQFMRYFIEKQISPVIVSAAMALAFLHWDYAL